MAARKWDEISVNVYYKHAQFYTATSRQSFVGNFVMRIGKGRKDF